MRAGGVKETMVSQFFTSSDFVLARPMILLSMFGLGILVIDLLVPAEWKRLNPFAALLGLAAAAVATVQIHMQFSALARQGLSIDHFTGFAGSMVVDRFALYFFYLFLIGSAVAVLISIRYL